MNKRLKQKKRHKRQSLKPGEQVPLWEFWSSASGGGGLLIFALVFATLLGVFVWAIV